MFWLLRLCLFPILPSAVLISKQTDWIKTIQVHSNVVTCTSARNLNICSCKIHSFSQQQNTEHSTREVTLKYNDFRPQNHCTKHDSFQSIMPKHICMNTFFLQIPNFFLFNHWTMNKINALLKEIQFSLIICSTISWVTAISIEIAD